MSRSYKWDKKLGMLVEEEATEREKEIADALEQDARKVRRGMKPRLMHRPGNCGYPFESEAMAVDPEDISMARDIARANGFSTEYTPSGEPIITSRSHFIKHMRAFGFYERNGTTSPRNR